MPYKPGPYQKYKMHRRNAITRGVRWLLTFEQWVSTWQESGRWEQRGKGIGKYCMARKRDRGAYRVGNVEIILFTRNISDGYVNGCHVNDPQRQQSQKNPRA